LFGALFITDECCDVVFVQSQEIMENMSPDESGDTYTECKLGELIPVTSDENFDR
jgi:hypothetical protein